MDLLILAFVNHKSKGHYWSLREKGTGSYQEGQVEVTKAECGIVRQE